MPGWLHFDFFLLKLSFVGKCFVAVSEEMKIVYAHYCKNHDDATALMEKVEITFPPLVPVCHIVAHHM